MNNDVLQENDEPLVHEESKEQEEPKVKKDSKSDSIINNLKDVPLNASEEYLCLCNKIRLINIMRALCALFAIITLLAILKFIEEMTILGSRQRMGSLLNVIMCLTTSVTFGVIVFKYTYNMKCRRMLKWAVVPVMIANFINGSMYVSDHLKPEYFIVMWNIIM